MPTIHEDIENLDRMVDGGAAKDEIRSQIRLIDREVNVLEAQNSRLVEAYTNLEEAAAKQVTDLNASHEQAMAELKKENERLIAENKNLITARSDPSGGVILPRHMQRRDRTGGIGGG